MWRKWGGSSGKLPGWPGATFLPREATRELGFSSLAKRRLKHNQNSCLLEKQLERYTIYTIEIKLFSVETGKEL